MSDDWFGKTGKTLPADCLKYVARYDVFAKGLVEPSYGDYDFHYCHFDAFYMMISIKPCFPRAYL